MFSQAMVQFSARNWPMLPDPLHRGVCLRGNEARSHLRLSVPSMFVKPWSNRTQFWLLRIVITTGLMGVRTCVSTATGSFCESFVHLRYKWLNYCVRMSKTSFGPTLSVSHSVFCVGRTQWVVLSAPATQNRVKNAQGGPK